MNINELLRSKKKAEEKKEEISKMSVSELLGLEEETLVKKFKGKTLRGTKDFEPVFEVSEDSVSVRLYHHSEHIDTIYLEKFPSFMRPGYQRIITSGGEMMTTRIGDEEKAEYIRDILRNSL